MTRSYSIKRPPGTPAVALIETSPTPAREQAAAPEMSRFLSVKQVAEYLHLNEKKVYTLVGEGKIPATKVTGKWLFPRHLIDQWM
ncbi:MAG: helix-turn-helix domain-containing protein, partial [Gammaproteobacteria bacterium]|nr:helix-turn-helix domain-containing protein [Gammaproteobacteria bacterium]